MKKKLLSQIFFILSCTMTFAESQDDRIASLLNYIQFSTCKIIESQNKGLLENEFSDILNNINPSSLKKSELINQYEYLLTSLTRLKLTQNQRRHLEEVSALKRKNAIFNSLNSFGSVLYVPSKDPASIGISLAYATLNAGFNYARTVNNIRLEENAELFELSQQDLKEIDSQRASLFITSTKIYKKNKFKSRKLINESEMKSFAKIASLVDSTYDTEELAKIAERNLPSLERMEESFRKFSPYWLTLGKCYMYAGQAEKASASFEKVYQIDNASTIFKNKKSPYIKEAAKNNIYLLMKNNDRNVEKYAEIIRNNSLLDQNTQDDLSYFFYAVYVYTEELDKAKKELDYLKKRGLEADFTQLSCSYNLLTNDISSAEHKLAEAMLKSLSQIRFGKTAELAELFASDKNLAKVQDTVYFTSGLRFISFEYRKIEREESAPAENKNAFLSFIDDGIDTYKKITGTETTNVSKFNLTRINLPSSGNTNFYYIPKLSWKALQSNYIITLSTGTESFSYTHSDSRDYSKTISLELPFDEGPTKKLSAANIMPCLIGINIDGIFEYYIPNVSTGKWEKVK